MIRFWRLLGALPAGAILAVDAAAAAAKAVPPPPDRWSAIADHLAWPVAALLIALALRRPLASFVSALGGRVTKLSVFNVSLEMAPAKAAGAATLLDQLRSPEPSPALINDSSRQMIEQFQVSAPADYSVIDIGTGEDWLTSRLYLAAAMLERMRGVRAFVFVERQPAVSRRFVAVADLRLLRWTLARRYPWLEVAWTVALRNRHPAMPNAPAMPVPGFIASDTGAFEPETARQIARDFIESLQTPVPPPPPPPNSALEWTTLDPARHERALWVTRDLLEEWLPQAAFRAWAPAAIDLPRDRRTRSVLRRGGDFVALVEEDMRFFRLVDRKLLMEELASFVAEEGVN